MKWRIICLTLILITLVVAYCYQKQPIVTERVVVQQPDKLDMYLYALAQVESHASSTIDHLDSNGRYSRGCLQFQDATFDLFSSKYKLQGNIYDCQFQHKLAKAMIEDDYNNYRHWLNSSYKLGKPPI